MNNKSVDLNGDDFYRQFGTSISNCHGNGTSPLRTPPLVLWISRPLPVCGSIEAHSSHSQNGCTAEPWTKIELVYIREGKLANNYRSPLLSLVPIPHSECIQYGTAKRYKLLKWTPHFNKGQKSPLYVSETLVTSIAYAINVRISSYLQTCHCRRTLWIYCLDINWALPT